ncbi:hypothetical protein KKH36_01470 [Patescibacteria group bacterium]|nr:hypothetical protein [Patescibacteria group bacterium]
MKFTKMTVKEEKDFWKKAKTDFVKIGLTKLPFLLGVYSNKRASELVLVQFGGTADLVRITEANFSKISLETVEFVISNLIEEAREGKSILWENYSSFSYLLGCGKPAKENEKVKVPVAA